MPFRVHRDRGDYGTWLNNPDIYRMVVAEERRGFCRGIGEFHVFGRDAGTPVVKDIAGLSPGWARMLRDHPKRFVAGSDTGVNERWGSHSALIDGYRKWHGELPADVAERVAWRNGAELFGLE